MSLSFGAVLSIFLLSAQGQEERPSAAKVVKKHGESLKKIDGVTHVGASGSADNILILIRVDSDEAKKTVREKVGKTLGGYRIFIYVSKPVGKTTVSKEKPDPPKKKPDPTKPTPLSLEDCDIMRDHLGLKRVLHRAKGRTYPSCQLMRRTRIGGAGGHGFWYTKHRVDCPIRTGHLEKPEDADKFADWVFTRGFLPAKKGSFLVYELKGSDGLWFDQVKRDLTKLLPYIREGAKWHKADKKKAGVGWEWKASKPAGEYVKYK